ncbi:MAG: lipoate--protein ligase family protein [Synechococcaceae cyanobacterium]|nr:lipoate--protein ligase family protein [Synechococcaceae cyanobacterium]
MRWIPASRLGGSWQMAIDTWLLERLQGLDGAQRSAGAVLRLYSWSRPTLSLGHHQRQLAPPWRRLAREGRLELVRRPSGGRAVLHGTDLTYALIWPDPPRQRRRAYGLACEWLRHSFAALDLPLHAGGDDSRLQPASCFASGTAADLVHADGGKRVGSAQLWRHGALLQHGSIQLAPDAGLWREVFGEEPPALAPLPIDTDGLIALLRQQAKRWLPMAAASGLEERDLSAIELARIAAELPRYRVEGTDADGEDSGSATSPELTIPRAT